MTFTTSPTIIRLAHARSSHVARLQCNIHSLRAPNSARYTRAVPLTYEQFRYAFANVVDENEAHELYEKYSVPAPGTPLFQGATANFNPWTEAQVDTKNPARGPLLIISGEYDHTVPWAISHASYKQQEKNPGLTEIHEIPDRGHSLTIDHGWREVAEITLNFVAQHLTAER